MNKALAIGLVGLGAYGLIRLLRMKNVGDSVSTRIVSPRIHKISLQGITFRTDVALNNPTRDSMSITKPVVTLSTGGKLLTQSVSENKVITIAPLAVTRIESVELTLGWVVIGSYVAGIVQKVPGIIAAFQSGDKQAAVRALGIPLEMTFSTYANGLFIQSKPEKIL